MIEEKRTYTMVCDNCGEEYYNKNGEHAFYDDDELYENAENDGWLFEEASDGNDLFFCSRECRDEYTRKFITPGTELDPAHVWFPQEGGQDEAQ